MKIIFVWKDGTETPAKYSVSGDFADAGTAITEELFDLTDSDPTLYSQSNLAEVKILL